jgi:hypothetical protein
MFELAPLLCFCAACWCNPAAPAAYPQVSRSAGDLWYTHEVLGHGKHLLRLSAGGLLLDSPPWRSDRIKTLAYDVASKTCSGRFRVIEEGRLSAYSGQLFFRCR